MPRIFMSFVHEDVAVARVVQSFLQTTLNMNDVFMSTDKAQVFAGDNWLSKITDSLRQADVVILMLSRRSVSRPWVNFEAGAAWLQDKPILPCCYGNMKKNELPHPYSAIQALNLVEEPEYLLSSVCHHLKVDEPEWIELFTNRYIRIINAVEKLEDITGTFVTKAKKKPK